MEVKKLYALLQIDENYTVGKQEYWNHLWSHYVEEKKTDYQSLSVKEAVARFISDQNLRERRNAKSCEEFGVHIRVGDICYVDFGDAYINEIGYQHFAIIIAIYHNKAFVIPMSGNEQSYEKAYHKKNMTGRKHLMQLGKMKGMNKKSVLFLNDAKFINTARIIDVKAHLNKESPLFHEIVERFKKCIS